MSERNVLTTTDGPPPVADPAGALSRAAHDLNNLCASILGFAALTQESLEASSPLHEYLNEVLEAAQKTSNVATELRLIARQLRACSQEP